jgi:hypothetical protein
MATKLETERLLTRAVHLFAEECNYVCGNCEGTPCDDLKPKYVCKFHRWLKAARKATGVAR